MRSFNDDTDVLLAPNEQLDSYEDHQRLLDDNTVDILLVEDEQSDVMLTRIALDAAEIPYELHTLEKGEDVMPYLDHEGLYADESTPDLVMLDLGLPHMDGFEVLAELAANTRPYRNIPIVILTGMEHFEYLQKSYHLWIAAYLTKPCTSEQIREVVECVRHGRHNPSLTRH